jgi:hypothetical protein
MAWPRAGWAGSPAASSPTGPKQNAPTAGRAAGQRQRRRRAGRHLASPRPGRQRHFTLGLSWPLSWPSSPGRTVAGFSAALPKCPAGGPRPDPGAGGHICAVPPGTAWGVLAADSCGCGSAGEGGPLGFGIGLLYTRFASMPQALWAALREDGHEVIRPEDLQIRTRACGVTGSVLAVLGDPHRCVEVGVDHGPGRAGDQARGARLCWGGAAAHRPVGT